MNEILIAAVCMTSTSDKTKNVESAVAYVREAAANGAQWVQLPEMFAFHGPYDRVYEMAELEGGPLFLRLSALAKELGIVLFAGSQGERPDRDRLDDAVLLNRNGHRRVYNTHYVFGRDGSLLAKYRKTHLFNLLDAEGRPQYCESDGYIAGDDLVSMTIDGFKVGLSICYDLRFPQLYERLVQAAGGSLDVLCVPSAFTKGTGHYHWELLLRARAVENQCYVFAANQVGEHGPGKESFGHSLLIDPWGTTVANTGAQSGLALGKISQTAIKEFRAKLPALANRRPSLYKA